MNFHQCNLTLVEIMTINAAYLFIASMDIDPHCEELFNELYETEHIPNLLKVPGVRRVVRFKGKAFEVDLGLGVKEVPQASPLYTAIYEIDHPDVVSSSDWSMAVSAGRWGLEVRPYIANRRYMMYEKCSQIHHALADVDTSLGASI